MTELMWKLRVAVLWIFLGVVGAFGAALLLYEPGTVRDMMRGEIQGAALGTAQVQLATQVLVPLGMAFITVAVSDYRANRTVNGVLGVLYAASALIALVLFSDPLAFGGVLAFIGVTLSLVSLLLLWHVWKWPVPGRVASSAHEGPAIRR